MAHNLNIRPNGKAAFVSKKQLAWHGLGTVFQEDVLTSKQAIELGGLDFEVEKRPLYAPSKIITMEEARATPRIQRHFTNVDGKIQANYSKLNLLTEKFATVRTDTDIPLGIVGSKYTVVQNQAAFDFFDDIAGDGVANYETAGALGSGEVVFITAKVTESMTIHKDQIDKYLLISLSHDGSSAITVAYTPIRVVCNNTLTLALKGSRNKVQIRHTLSAHDRLNAAKATLGLIKTGDVNHTEYFNRLLDVNVDEGQVIDLFINAYKIDTTNLSTKGKNILEANLDYYYKGLGQEAYVGTGWGAYNAVTGYLHNIKTYTSIETKFKAELMTNQQAIRDNVVSELLIL